MSEGVDYYVPEDFARFTQAPCPQCKFVRQIPVDEEGKPFDSCYCVEGVSDRMNYVALERERRDQGA